MSWALSGCSRNATSPSNSTYTPPRPNITSGPNVGSCVTPTTASMPPGTYSCTSTPSSVAPILSARAASSSNALRTSSSERRSSTTPPTSDLCTTSLATSFITTGKPSAAATAAASSALFATALSGVRMPYSPSRWTTASGSSQPSLGAGLPVRRGRRPGKPDLRHRALGEAEPLAVAGGAAERARGGFRERVRRQIAEPGAEAVRAHEDRRDRLARARRAVGDGAGDVRRRGHQRRHEDHEQHVHQRIGEQRLGGAAVALRVRRRDHVHRVLERRLRRQERRELSRVSADSSGSSRA